MQVKAMLGVLLTGIVLFMFGFLYWGVNPLPYKAWNSVEDPAAVQSAAGELFPQDGVYFIPGPGNQPEALKLLETGPAMLLTIDHSPVAGPDPRALAMGLVHNILCAALLLLGLSKVSGPGGYVGTSTLIGICACFVINGSEIVWWMQPLAWITHQVIYYLLYFALAGFVLSFFLSKRSQ